MKIHRFFIDQKIENQEEISLTNPELLHQMNKVLRLKEGDAVVLLDGSGKEFHGKIGIITKQVSSIYKENVTLSTDEKDVAVKLCPAILKKDKFEWVIQKVTEIGVNQVIPIISERTEKVGLNIERLKKISLEACEQSERSTIMDIAEPQTFEDFLKNKNNAEIFVLDFDGEIFDKEKIISDKNSNKEIFVLIGPEGGWTNEERKYFAEKKIKSISLGKNILRGETASVAVATLLLLGK